MRITDSVHSIKIPFHVTTPSGESISRFVNVYLIFGEQIYIVDSGVSNSEHAIFEYIRATGRNPEEISHLILTHSHPDHIGAARAIKKVTGCTICAHPAEKSWIEDIELQSQERPVPGFHALVGGSVAVDQVLEDGTLLPIDKNLKIQVVHTPGHSRGSISLFLQPDGILFTGDAIPLPGDIPIYEDVESLIHSIRILTGIKGVKYLLAAWDDPRQDEHIALRYRTSLDFLQRIHKTVVRIAESSSSSMDMCLKVLDELGLPRTIANPLLVASFESHRKVRETEDIFFRA